MNEQQTEKLLKILDSLARSHEKLADSIQCISSLGMGVHASVEGYLNVTLDGNLELASSELFSLGIKNTTTEYWPAIKVAIN